MIRALIVEDDPILGRAIGRALSRALDIVDVVPGSEEALQRLEVDRVDVIITDYDLGPWSSTGVDLAAVVRARWPDVPIVLASGSITPDVRSTALLAGIDACLTKPVPIDALITIVRRLVEVRGGDVGGDACDEAHPPRRDG